MFYGVVVIAAMSDSDAPLTGSGAIVSVGVSVARCIGGITVSRPLGIVGSVGVSDGVGLNGTGNAVTKTVGGLMVGKVEVGDGVELGVTLGVTVSVAVGVSVIEGILGTGVG